MLHLGIQAHWAHLADSLKLAYSFRIRGATTCSISVPTARTRGPVRVARSDKPPWLVVSDRLSEADAQAERFSFLSPMARTLMGHAAGDVVTFTTHHGDEELEILSVALTENSSES